MRVVRPVPRDATRDPPVKSGVLDPVRRRAAHERLGSGILVPGLKFLDRPDRVRDVSSLIEIGAVVRPLDGHDLIGDRSDRETQRARATADLMLFFLLLTGPAAAASIFSVSSFCRNCTVWGHSGGGP